MSEARDQVSQQIIYIENSIFQSHQKHNDRASFHLVQFFDTPSNYYFGLAGQAILNRNLCPGHPRLVPF